MEEADCLMAAWLDYKFVLDAILSELQADRFLIYVVLFDVDYHSTLAIHLIELFVCDGSPLPII